MVSAVLLVPLRRDALSCLAMSCPINQHHGRYYQGAARVLITRCGGAPRHINLRTTRRQYSATRNVFTRETRINTKAATRQPLTPLRKATPAATSEPCPEQQLITRQNRCLQGVCKCSGASVSHFVASESQCGEGLVRLTTLHRSDHTSCQPTSMSPHEHVLQHVAEQWYDVDRCALGGTFTALSTNASHLVLCQKMSRDAVTWKKTRHVFGFVLECSRTASGWRMSLSRASHQSYLSFGRCH